RSVGAVLSSLQYLVQDIRDRGHEPDFELLSLILDYIDAFPERLHHPKEDKYLFALLRARTNEADRVLDELQAEHAKGDALIRTLRHTLALYRVNGPAGFPAFASGVDDYVDFHWRHMRAEEDIILPLAERLLTEADWLILDAAFSENSDPLFGPNPQDTLRKLFQLIVRLAPAPLGLGGSPPPHRTHD
ncbi:MAG: hemerythrin domain-containing protein, partial [Candidatus Rokubacteria bacterium]|nr:hemerythrin domain-containing protein [Candidatus Rokubacteria bacterium]